MMAHTQPNDLPPPYTGGLQFAASEERHTREATAPSTTPATTPATLESFSIDEEGKSDDSAKRIRVCGFAFKRTSFIVIVVAIILVTLGAVAGALGAVLPGLNSDTKDDDLGPPPFPNQNGTLPGNSTPPLPMEIGDSGGGIGRLALAAANCGTDDMFVFHQDDSGVLWYRFFDNAKFENENGTVWPWGNDTMVGGQLDPMLSTPMTAVCWNDSDTRIVSLHYLSTSSTLLGVIGTCSSDGVDCTWENEVVPNLQPDQGPSGNTLDISSGSLAAVYLEETGLELFFLDNDAQVHRITYQPWNQSWTDEVTVVNGSCSIAAVAVEGKGGEASWIELLFIDQEGVLQVMTIYGEESNLTTPSSTTTSHLTPPLIASLSSLADGPSTIPAIEVQYNVLSTPYSQFASYNHSNPFAPPPPPPPPPSPPSARSSAPSSLPAPPTNPINPPQPSQPTNTTAADLAGMAQWETQRPISRMPSPDTASGPIAACHWKGIMRVFYVAVDGGISEDVSTGIPAPYQGGFGAAGGQTGGSGAPGTFHGPRHGGG